MSRYLSIAVLVFVPALACAQDPPATKSSGWQPSIRRLLAGEFRWKATDPLISPASRPEDPCHAIKDPSVVFHGGRWHVFCTIRSQRRTHQIEYLSFADWKNANKAERHVLKICDGYFCAPQVFFFAPQKKWYLLFQTSAPDRKPQLQPAFSTNDDVGNPAGWSKPTLLFEQAPTIRSWIDFWMICDAENAHLFFTSLDGQMWRSSTKLADFPRGWSQPVVCLRGDIFEASHTYYLKGLRRYLTVVEAQDGGRRYYKAYLASKLDGAWTPLADTKAKPFAARSNVREDRHWTDSFSHGEILRDGVDQTMAIDPTNIRFLFQGVSDEDKAGKSYGQIPWLLGLLEADHQ